MCAGHTEYPGIPTRMWNLKLSETPQLLMPTDEKAPTRSRYVRYNFYISCAFFEPRGGKDLKAVRRVDVVVVERSIGVNGGVIAP